MAKQQGIIPLKGTIGNITFYKSKDGYLAREKGGIDANRIATDPAFQRTRENGAEFGRAGVAGKVLRTALRAVLLHAADSKMVSRLSRELMKVIQADETNPRGQRNVIDGALELLTGFDFNEGGKLSTALYAPYEATINRVEGTMSIEIPGFVPSNSIAAPAGTTHFKIISAGAAIDFENESSIVDSTSTGELPWNDAITENIALETEVAANSTHPLLIALGIGFFQAVNGTMYPLKNGAFNSLALVKIDTQTETP